MSVQDTVSLTVTNCRGLQSSREHVVQLHQTTIQGAFPDKNENDYVLVYNPDVEIEPNPALPARIEVNNRVKRDEIGIGTNMHTALGIGMDDEVEVAGILPKEPYGEEKIARLLHTRPAICRVRRSVFPDPEFRVCRLPYSVMSLIGIEEGDRVVLESAWDRTRVRALKMTESMKRRKKELKKANPERYPPTEEVYDIDHALGSTVDIPDIYIDYDTRDELSILEQEGDGTGSTQPIRVYRDNRSVFLDLLDDLTLPSLAVLVSLFLLINPFLNFQQAAAIIGNGFVLFILFTMSITVHRARKQI
jgi:hypothetical protein